jgi:hypothetical protein
MEQVAQASRRCSAQLLKLWHCSKYRLLKLAGGLSWECQEVAQHAVGTVRSRHSLLQQCAVALPDAQPCRVRVEVEAGGQYYPPIIRGHGDCARCRSAHPSWCIFLFLFLNFRFSGPKKQRRSAHLVVPHGSEVRCAEPALCPGGQALDLRAKAQRQPVLHQPWTTTAGRQGHSTAT